MQNFSLLQNWWQIPLLAVVSYLIGCFNFAVLISRRKKRDITKIGSGNPGTMNMSREFGLKVGLLTFFCDALKGAVPCVIAYFLYRNFVFTGTAIAVSDVGRYFCGLFVVIGHIFPVTMRFKGGKGIASTLGLFWAGLSCENAWWILIGFAFLLLVVAFIFWTEWGSLGSLLGVTGFSIIQAIFFFQNYAVFGLNAYTVCLFLLIFTIDIFTWLAHYKNLSRLFAGEEHRTSLRKIAKKK